MTFYAPEPMPYLSDILRARRQSIREDPPEWDNATWQTSNVAGGMNDSGREVLARALMRIARIVLSLYLYEDASARPLIADYIVGNYSMRGSCVMNPVYAPEVARLSLCVPFRPRQVFPHCCGEVVFARLPLPGRIVLPNVACREMLTTHSERPGPKLPNP